MQAWKTVYLATVSCLVVACRQPEFHPDAQLPSDLVALKPANQEELTSAVNNADHLMEADVPLTAEVGVGAFNKLMENCAHYREANKTDGGEQAISSLGRGLTLATELKGELKARFPKQLEEAAPVPGMAELYAGSGRWAGPERYLRLVGNQG